MTGSQRPYFKRFSLAFSLATLTWCASSWAQPYNSTLGRFQVDQKKGCASLTINLTNLLPGECMPGTPCTMNFGDNTPPAQNVFVHTYTTPGTYTLSVLYQSIGADNIVITVDQNIQPPFEIYACNGHGARIKVIDNNYDQYVIDFTNDGTPEYILPFSNNILTGNFTYAPPGTYTPSVRGRDLNSADNCTASVQTFTSMATLPAPTITNLTMIDAANLTLNFSTVNNVLYRLEVSQNSASSFQVLQSLYGVNTVNLSSLELDNKFYCFRLGAHNPCTNTTTYSNIICSNLLEVTAQSDQLTVNSNFSNTGIMSYTLQRTSPTQPPVTITTTTEPFVDVDVECKSTYCYKVTTNYGSGRTSISLEKCATAFSDTQPAAIDDVTATVGPPGATLTFTQDPQFDPVNGYNVQRSSAGGLFGHYTTVSASPFTDNVYTTEGRYCYKIDYIDKCDNQSGPGVAVCPVQLYGILGINNEITLYWTRYRGWSAGVNHYTLEKYSVEGALILSVTQSDTVFLDNAPDVVNQYVRYVIKAVPNDVANNEGLSNERVFIRNSNLYFPTAFTPNKDGLNDGFSVQGQYIVKMKLTIFDRWGAVLFSTDKNEAWDGSGKGGSMPPSTYVWKAEIVDRAGQNYSREGTVALIRD